MNSLPIPPAIAKIAPDGNLTPRQLRRFMIDMTMRRIKPGTGSSHEFLKRRTAYYQWPDLRPILEGTRWAIVGDVATRAYMAEITTKDFDIIVHEQDGENAVKKLRATGYKIVSQISNSDCQMLSPDGVKLKVLFGKHCWLKEALDHPKQDPAGYPVVALPYLVILKMLAQRPQDWADVSRMLGWAEDVDLDEVRAAIKTYAPEDEEDLESLIFLGKKEQEIPPPSDALE
jgi:hypothetical protein